MAWDSEEDVRHKAVDIGRLLVEAADNSAVDGVIGIIDTCNAAGAQPQSSGLVTGSRGGQTRLSLLMASAVGQEAYDLSMSRELSGLLRAGLPNAGPKLSLYDVLTYLRTVMRNQDLISAAYDGDQSSGSLWLAHNRQKMVGVLPLGSNGAAQLLEALKFLCPGKTFAETWSADRLRDLRDDLDSMSPSPELTRVRRLIDNLVVAQKTISFLRSVMAAALSTQSLRRALTAPNNAPMGVLMNPARGAIISEADAVEFVALNFPLSEKSCRPRMARFVLHLAAEAGLDLSGEELRGWAASIEADVALNDALERWQYKQAERRLRLIVSLHYALAEDWPEELGAWLLYDNEFYQHKDFNCVPDQAGVEEALGEAVDWAEEYARELGAPLRRIEVAVPTSKLLQWHPEEVEYGQRLGVNYEVLTRWSYRLESISSVRRININAWKRLKEIAGLADVGRINWLAGHQVVESDRLRDELRAGMYTRAIGLIEDPGDNVSLLELLLIYTPIVVWPQFGPVNAEHRRRVDACWNLLPAEFVMAYRTRWRAEGIADPLADLRAVWDDEEWLEFCKSLQMGRA